MLQAQDRRGETPPGSRGTLARGIGSASTSARSRSATATCSGTASMSQHACRAWPILDRRLSGITYEILRPARRWSSRIWASRRSKNVDTPIQVYLARPRNAGERALPRPHRDQEIHLARRFFNAALHTRSARRNARSGWSLSAPVLASAEDEPGIGERKIAGWLGITTANARAIVAKLVDHGLIEHRNEGSGPAGPYLTELGSEAWARNTSAGHSGAGRGHCHLFPKRNAMS